MSGPLDPAALQVLIARLDGVAEEMSAVLRRSASSPNIKERADCSSAVFTATGELLAQAENIPVHLGAMPASVAAVLAAVEDAGGEVVPGQQWIVNDPFAGGTHLNDITVVAPCHVDGALVGWVANRAHHADVGGSAPGSIPAGAVEVFEEGLRLPPVRLTPEVRAVLLANSRTPTERAGDLDAQVGANVRGAARLAEVVAGLGGPAAAARRVDEVLAWGERRMRAALAALPDGRWSFEDRLDSFGPEPAQQRPVAIRVVLTIDGDGVTVDLSGSDPQQPGNVNAPAAVTVSSVAFALRSAVDPTLPANGGALRPVHVVARPGTVVDARPPAAVGAGNVEVSQRVADVCFGALAQVVPERIGAASQGTMNNLLIGGSTGAAGELEAAAEPAWVYYETLGGGQGGRPTRAGMSGVHTAMTNTCNTPVEALERAFPLRVRRLALRRGTGGAGAHPGGDGIDREVELLAPAVVSLITERRTTPPWGLAGGEPGAVGENWLLPGGDEGRARRLPDKVTLAVAPGDVLRIRTPGGGGWGRAPGGGGSGRAPAPG